jgi:hypothetical protein
MAYFFGGITLDGYLDEIEKIYETPQRRVRGQKREP